MRLLPPISRDAGDEPAAAVARAEQTPAAAAEYARVAAAAAAELAKRRLCGATEGGGVCQLDAGHRPPHRARVGERIETPAGPRRNVIEWGRP